MPWICPSCSAETELGYNVCSKCQTPRPGSEEGAGDFKLGDDNLITIAADFLGHIGIVVVAELVIPWLLNYLLGIPLLLGVLIVFAFFGAVVFYLSRRDGSKETNAD
ncbi:putative membrane protein [Rhodopirellula maiorica SM1]|uniref:Putative membrane protein n=1 Tax=Rhodopirellula maiorica SM1 TaxID=1265738 RepID=M5RQP4_9BACT|nr:membrane protein [Rhodopirellula maiorica]EMI21658.1 putative membrane protein [Rhodopirellula maiorica SM1]